MKAMAKRDGDLAVDFRGSIPIGDIGQYLQIRGADSRNVMLLYLHGGPGAVETPFINALYRDIESRYTVACWEQRGAGRSYSKDIPAESMNIQRFVADAGEVIEYLKKTYGKKKILLVGDSWGGFLGMLVAQQYPESILAYVALVPAINMGESLRLSRGSMLRTASETSNKGALRMLNESLPPYDFSRKGEWQRCLKHLQMVAYFGGYLYGKKNLIPLVKYYGVIEILKMMKSQEFAFRSMGNELMSTDLSVRIPELRVPLYLGLSRGDGNMPAETALRFFDALKAPQKELLWFEKSAHTVVIDEPEKVKALLVDIVLPRIERETSR